MVRALAFNRSGFSSSVAQSSMRFCDLRLPGCVAMSHVDPIASGRLLALQ